MGGSTSKDLSDSVGRLPPLVCVCCESTYVDKSLGEVESADQQSAETWTADCVDEPGKG